MTAIKTVYVGPTNTHGSLIIARYDGKTAHTAAFSHAFSFEQNHVHAAQEVAHQLGLTGGKLHSSYLEPGVHVHVWVESAKPATVAPKTEPTTPATTKGAWVDLGLYEDGRMLSVRVYFNGWITFLGGAHVAVGELRADAQAKVRAEVKRVCEVRGWADLSTL